MASVQRTQSHLLRVISTMEADFLRPNPPPCLDAMEDYAEGSSSQLLYLQVCCSQAVNSTNTAELSC